MSSSSASNATMVEQQKVKDANPSITERAKEAASSIKHKLQEGVDSVKKTFHKDETKKEAKKSEGQN